MSVSIKICGVSSEADIGYAAAAHVEMIGLVFFEKSPRHLERDQAAYLSRIAGTQLKRVLVTVDANDELLSGLIEAIRPEILQLHGSESPERVSAIRHKFSVPVMKSIGINEEKDLCLISGYEPVSDYILCESKAGSAADRPGGNGISFDWSLLKEIKASRPWFIAGGLNSSNVERALNLTGAQGVDVSSGVERSPGIKDGEKIGEFVREVRRVETSLMLDRQSARFS